MVLEPLDVAVHDTGYLPEESEVLLDVAHEDIRVTAPLYRPHLFMEILMRYLGLYIYRIMHISEGIHAFNLLRMENVLLYLLFHLQALDLNLKSPLILLILQMRVAYHFLVEKLRLILTCLLLFSLYIQLHLKFITRIVNQLSQVHLKQMHLKLNTFFKKLNQTLKLYFSIIFKKSILF